MEYIKDLSRLRKPDDKTRPIPLTDKQIIDIIKDVPNVVGADRDAVLLATQQRRYYLFKVLKNVVLSPVAFEKYKKAIVDSYSQATIQVGAPVGTDASAAVGGPVSQSALKSFHQAGSGANVGSVSEILRELLFATKERKHPTTSICFKNKRLSFRQVFEKTHEFVETKASDLIKDYMILDYDEAGIIGADGIKTGTGKHYWWWTNFELITSTKIPIADKVLMFTMNVDMMKSRKVTMKDFATVIEKDKPDSFKCVYGPISDGIIYIIPVKAYIKGVIEKEAKGYANISPEFQSDIFLAKVVLPSMNKIRIKGMKGIKKFIPIIENVWKIVNSEKLIDISKATGIISDVINKDMKSKSSSSRESKSPKKEAKKKDDIKTIISEEKGKSSSSSSSSSEKSPKKEEKKSSPNYYLLELNVKKIFNGIIDQSDLSNLLESMEMKIIHSFRNKELVELVTEDVKKVYNDYFNINDTLIVRSSSDFKEKIEKLLEKDSKEHIRDYLEKKKEEEKSLLEEKKGTEFDVGPITKASQVIRAMTEGINLIAVMSRLDVNQNKSTTNDVYEMKNYLGVESARSYFIEEFVNVITGAGSSLSLKYIYFMADFLFSRGEYLGVTYFGLTKQDTGFVEQATLERNFKTLASYSTIGSKQETKRTIPAIFAGVEISSGTGLIEVKALDKLQKLYEDYLVNGSKTTNKSEIGITAPIGKFDDSILLEAKSSELKIKELVKIPTQDEAEKLAREKKKELAISKRTTEDIEELKIEDYKEKKTKIDEIIPVTVSDALTSSLIDITTSTKVLPGRIIPIPNFPTIKDIENIKIKPLDIELPSKLAILLND